jgi:methionyl aminopeptidase
VEKHGYSVVRDYCGHGLGKVFHDAPNVLHYGKPGTGAVIREGMFFTVEPMVNAGHHDTRLNEKDGWTVTTRDRSLSAQFEHSVGVTADGVEIFTTSPAGKHFPPY